MSSRSYIFIILQIMLWHQSLKSIHYTSRTLLIFLAKKQQIWVKTWGGGIKDMLSPPPCQNMGGIYHPHPLRLYALEGGSKMLFR